MLTGDYTLGKEGASVNTSSCFNISNLLGTLNECSKAFSAVGGDVSLFKEMDHRILDKAFQTYVKGLEKGISSYNLAFRRLKEEVGKLKTDTPHRNTYYFLLISYRNTYYSLLIPIGILIIPY
ncbi:hypothetical protein AVEN_122343-1 [Araneus ventricosus]|uniref:Uncharacterized protein n=1 Tax=Araneus ventricosus TaxID=182803 RepID=A0A4Y2T066_ARAVE|nr:hypothetical protein AVEN_267013-1 [Araneus ventricosus]GBN93283.1 hypothetical protein AVEN_61912-1 [Araneus ventricosus]GBN93294.1 hypothetical protein AVEN_265868-1 [Araneus ventricosus]GBN93388.1 hypothetical protein AVEN_122343-1 [Araneus ventricosus]